MPAARKKRNASCLARPPLRAKPRCEELESRDLLSSAPILTLSATEFENNDTIDRAQDLRTLHVGQAAQVTGAVAAHSGVAADVDFYQFTLADPARVRLSAQRRPGVGALSSVLTLYNSDPSDFIGHRLVAQDDGASHGGNALIDRSLARGTYFVAVSGTGNRYFHPFLPDSGYTGSEGPYTFSVAASDPLLPAGSPAVLAADLVPGRERPGSPDILRITFSAPLALTSLQLGSTVRLLYSPTETFPGGGSDVTLESATFNDAPSVSELLVKPAAPLRQGYYRLLLAGDPLTHGTNVVRGRDAASTPLGKDVILPFHVAGVEGNLAPGAGSDNTPQTAHELGNVIGGQLVQVEGFIGDDPNDPAKFFNPSDVDFYHFHIAAGTYAFAAEVFGGRIGSPLDPALSLFRQTDSGLEFVAGNTTTGNTTLPTEGGPPLLSDAALFVPLTRGDYYLAVSSGFNYADPEGGLIPGQDGVFDPEIPYKGENGNSIGRYVLNLKVQQATTPPRVIGMTLVDGEAFAGPPTTFRVDFSGPVNVQELAFFAYVRTSESRVSPVFIRDAGGHLYFPRLQSYDPTTYRATFLMVDALPRGSYELHLSGPLGLTDLAGNALVGNDPSGDHVTRFSVGGPARGTPGNPSAWQSREPNDSLDSPQVLGPLFPAELDSTHTVTITVPAPPKGAGGGDTGDFFQFDLLQEQDYVFALSDATALDAETVPVIWGKGILQATLPQGPGAVFAHLTPGTYIVGVSFPSGGADVSYTLTLFMLGSPEPATPLTAGPAPALRVRLVGEEATSPGGPAQPPGFPSLLSLSGTEAGPPTVTNLGLPGIFLALADAPLGGMGGSDPATQGGTQVVRLDLSSPEQQAVNPLLTVLVAQSVLPGGVDGTIEPSPEGGAGKESDTFGEFQEFLRQRLPVGALLGEVSRTTSCLTEGGQRLTRMLDGLFETVGQWASSRDLLVPERPQGDRTTYVETHGSRERVVARQVVETEDSCAEGDACEVRSPTGGLWWVSASLGLFLGALRGWRWWGNRAGRRPALSRGEGVIPPKTDTEDWAG